MEYIYSKTKSSKFLSVFLMLALAVPAFMVPTTAGAVPVNPDPTTTAASDITLTGATVNGTNGPVNAENTSFWWGTTPADPFTAGGNTTEFPSTGWTHDSGLGFESADASFSENLTGLTPGTPYYFAAWSLVDGTWYPGAVLNFTTLATPIPPTTGTIQITKYVCPADTLVNRTNNGVGLTVPSLCVPQSGATFGYVHGTQTDANAPFPELTASLTAGSSTDGSGILSINNLPADRRYLVVETDNSNTKIPDENILGLYCEKDGDQNPSHNDNQELTFVTAGGTTNCVAYNKATTPSANVAPVVNNLNLITDENVATSSTLTATDTDGPNALVFATSSNPSNGALSGTLPNFTYTPNTDFFGTDLFTFTAGDGLATTTGTVNITINQVVTQTDNGGGNTSSFKSLSISNNSSGSRQRDISNLLASNAGVGGVEEVLGASTGPACEEYLKSYIKLGANNDPEEVKKLQIFLNQFFEVKNPVTGFYGPITFDMVKKFQTHQNVAVLTPWSIAGFPTDGPTGYVYKTTKRWINILKCPETVVSSPIPSLP